MEGYDTRIQCSVFVGTIEAIRFAVTGAAPLAPGHGVLLADAANRVAGRKLAAAGLADDRRSDILGSGGAATGHGHAHWFPSRTESRPAQPFGGLFFGC